MYKWHMNYLYGLMQDNHLTGHNMIDRNNNYDVRLAKLIRCWY